MRTWLPVLALSRLTCSPGSQATQASWVPGLLRRDIAESWGSAG